MESRFNIHIYIYDDLPMLKEAVGTIPDDIRIHVFDGRYADYPGETDLTPGAEEWCGSRGNITYHRPDSSRLPFGQGGSSANRASQHEKGCWANYDVLPEDQWSLQMDTDERLVRLDREVFEDLKDDYRYRPPIPIDDGRTVTQPRIWKPKYWTLWIDDCAIPRDKVHRNTNLDELEEKWRRYRGEKSEHLSDEDILIENVGMSRPDEYKLRRVVQLYTIERPHRALQVIDEIDGIERHEIDGAASSWTVDRIWDHLCDRYDGYSD